MDVMGLIERMTEVHLGLGVLASVVVVLYTSNRKTNKKTERQLEECVARDRKTSKAITEMSGAIGELRGRQAGVEAFGASVLAEVREAVKGISA